jgi:tetratricopeptide (TPR) repeat protein
MYETLLERAADAQVCPVSEPESSHEAMVSCDDQDRTDCPLPTAQADSFLALLDDLERCSKYSDRSSVIARYKAWIGRNSEASAALYAAWFNLGVELAGAGDKAGAISAYQTVLTLRPGFYPAAINLGTLMEAAGQPEAALAAWRRGLQPEDDRIALLDYRARLVEARLRKQQAMAAVLHVGCGAPGQKKLPPAFLDTGWREIRVDADPDVRPDFLAGLTDMQAIPDGLADAVYSSDPIEHLYPHQVALALSEMRRVLKSTGFAMIRLPDLQEIARHVAEGRLEDALYVSPIGPITALDMLYGYRSSLASGRAPNTGPRTGFTSATIGAALISAGFSAAMVQRDPSTFSLTAIAFRSRPDDEQMARVRMQMLPAADHPVVLWTPSD